MIKNSQYVRNRGELCQLAKEYLQKKKKPIAKIIPSGKRLNAFPYD